METSFASSGLIAAAVLILGVATVDAADTTVGAEHVITVRGHDGRDFAVTRVLERDEARHTVYRLTYPSPVVTDIEANNTIPAEYYQPKGLAAGQSPRPGVICLHILNGDFELVRLLCAVMADNGIPAIMFKLPYYGERRPPGDKRRLLRDVTLFAQGLDQTMLDIGRTVDVLAVQPEVDGDKIGITGISLGAVLSGAAGGLDTRIHRVAMLLGAGNVPRIMATAHEMRELRNFREALPPDKRAVVDATLRRVDPLTHADALRRLAADGRLLMVNAEQDEVVPPECTRELAHAAGIEDRVVWLPGLGHYTALAALPEIIERLVPFFAADMPAGVAPPAPPATPEKAPIDIFTDALRQLVDVMATPPTDGHCHYVKLRVEYASRGDDPKRGELEYIRGHGERFTLRVSIPGLGAAALGCNDSPWLRATGGKLFVGSEARDGLKLADFLDPRVAIKLRVAVGAVTALTLSPETLGKYVAVADAAARSDDSRTLAIELMHKSAKGTGTWEFSPDGATPRKLVFKGRDLSGTITFEQWRTNAPAPSGLFAPPTHTGEQAVAAADVYRMFGAALYYVVEAIQ